jgi:hypothetical protein
MIHKENIPVVGQLDAQVILAAGNASGAIFVKPDGVRRWAVVCHVGAFSGAVTKVDFVLKKASDAAGTGAAAFASSPTVSITTEKTTAVFEFDPALIAGDAKPFLAVNAAVTGGTSAPCTAFIVELDPAYK